MVNCVSPLLVRVIDCCALAVRISCAGKVSDEADRLTSGPIPVPLSAMLGAGPAALVLSVSAPVRLPRATGVNVILSVQLAPAATAPPQLLV